MFVSFPAQFTFIVNFVFLLWTFVTCAFNAEFNLNASLHISHSKFFSVVWVEECWSSNDINGNFFPHTSHVRLHCFSCAIFPLLSSNRCWHLEQFKLGSSWDVFLSASTDCPPYWNSSDRYRNWKSVLRWVFSCVAPTQILLLWNFRPQSYQVHKYLAALPLLSLFLALPQSARRNVLRAIVYETEMRPFARISLDNGYIRMILRSPEFPMDLQILLLARTLFSFWIRLFR